MRNDRAEVQRLHDQTEALVNRVVALNEELNRDLERRSDEARRAQAALLSRARAVQLACFALALLIGAGVGFVTVRSILRRLSALRAGAREIATGNLAARIAEHGGDELSELAGAFNRMAADLAHHQDALVRSQKLAAIGQVAAGVAHEINNPLGVILGYAKLLSRGGGADPNEGLGIIEDEARQCQRIVQGLLDLARPPWRGRRSTWRSWRGRPWSGSARPAGSTAGRCPDPRPP